MNKTRKMAIVAMIAAVYTVVSLVLAPISYGAIQCRVSEALCMLPIIYAPAIPGVILGCFLTNLFGVITGANSIGIIDCVVGTLATAIAAYLTYIFRNRRVKGIPLLSALMPVIVNGIMIGAELGYLFFPDNMVFGTFLSGIEVALGEIIAVVLGLVLNALLMKTTIFKESL